MENSTGNPDVDYLATGIDEEIAKRLAGIGGLIAKSAARAEWTPQLRADLPRVGRALGVQRAFRGTLRQVSDSFVVTGDVIEIANGSATPIRREAFLVDQASDVASRVSASILGALFRTSVPEMPRGKADRVDAESFRLTLQGWHVLLSNPNGGANAAAEAQALFDAAIQRDPTNARAHAGLSSVWAARAASMQMPFDDGARLSEAEARKALYFDPQEGTAMMNLAAMLGYRRRSIVAAESLFVRAATADPGNPEIPTVRGALYRHAWKWDRALDQVRIGRELDPLSASLVDREALISFCTDNAAEALRLYRMEVVMSPNDTLAMRNVARALARLGRWDEAAEQLRRVSPPALVQDTTPIDSLTGSKRVYWQLVHADGKRRLARALAKAGPAGVPSVRLAWLRIGAGEMDAGLDELAKAAARGDVAVYRSPCQPDADEAKASPRFQRILASLPRWE